MFANTTEELRPVAAKEMTAPREVLTLRLGGEEYGIDILRVQEIRFYERPTRIAGGPPHFLGVTNLRGVIVPIVDLRCRFGLVAACNTDTTTVVLGVGVGGRTVGAVVDSVSDLVALTAEQIIPAPEFNAVVHAPHYRHCHAGRRHPGTHVDPAGYRRTHDRVRDDAGRANPAVITT